MTGKRRSLLGWSILCRDQKKHELWKKIRQISLLFGILVLQEGGKQRQNAPIVMYFHDRKYFKVK